MLWLILLIVLLLAVREERKSRQPGPHSSEAARRQVRPDLAEENKKTVSGKTEKRI